MKFDVIVANPPYQKGLHLKFLDKCIDMKHYDGEIIFVHPAEWLVQKRQTSRTKLHDILKSKIKGANITFIDNPWRMDAALFVPLSITHIYNNEYYFVDNRTKIYGDLVIKPKPKIKINSLYEITTFGNPNTTLSFINKIFLFCEKNNWKNKIKIKNDGNYFVNLVSIAGGGKTSLTYNDGVIRTISNMYSIINELTSEIYEMPQYAKTGLERVWVSFKDINEANNCLNFISKTKIFRVYLSIIKIDQHAADTLLPWIPWLDWTQEWTDDKLIEFFNLTDEEVQNIDEIIDIITIK